MSNNKIDPEKWEEASKVFIEAMKEIEDEQEEWWNSLSKDDQLKAFCCISRRIYQGEIVENRSYRGMLYSTMGFGPEHMSKHKMPDILKYITTFIVALKNLND